MLIVEPCAIPPGYVAVWAPDGTNGEGVIESYSECGIEAAAQALERAMEVER